MNLSWIDDYEFNALQKAAILLMRDDLSKIGA